MQDREKLEGPHGQRRTVNMNNNGKDISRPELNCESLTRQSVLLQFKPNRKNVL